MESNHENSQELELLKSAGLEESDNPDRDIVRPAPRIVVYGQLPYRRNPESGEVSGGFWSGSMEVVDAMVNYLHSKGLSDDGIVQTRDVENIENAFFRGRRSDRPQLDTVTDNPPDLVFVFSAMRMDDWSGSATVNTPVEQIEALCRQFGVPMVLVDDHTSPEELNSILRKITTTQRRQIEGS